MWQRELHSCQKMDFAQQWRQESECSMQEAVLELRLGLWAPGPLELRLSLWVPGPLELRLSLWVPGPLELRLDPQLHTKGLWASEEL